MANFPANLAHIAQAARILTSSEDPNFSHVFMSESQRLIQRIHLMDHLKLPKTRFVGWHGKLPGRVGPFSVILPGSPLPTDVVARAAIQAAAPGADASAAVDHVAAAFAAATIPYFEGVFQTLRTLQAGNWLKKVKSLNMLHHAVQEAGGEPLGMEIDSARPAFAVTGDQLQFSVTLLVSAPLADVASRVAARCMRRRTNQRAQG